MRIIRFRNHYYIGVFPEEWKVCGSENGVVEVGKENYYFFGEVTKDFVSVIRSKPGAF